MKNFRTKYLLFLGLILIASHMQAETSNLFKRQSTKVGVGTAAIFTEDCQTIKPLEHALLKNNAGGHIGRRDRRYHGFAFICGKECPATFPVQAYYSDGAPAFKLGYYGRWNGNGQPRAYCAAGGAPFCNVPTVRMRANIVGREGLRRDGKVYLSFGNGICQTAIPGIRNGDPFK